MSHCPDEDITTVCMWMGSILSCWSVRSDISFSREGLKEPNEARDAGLKWRFWFCLGKGDFENYSRSCEASHVIPRKECSLLH